ncbi:MAG TPA: helix-turn-helix domain-containing protein, partial [Solirubrobacterales bacterium]|nr:helix-turn-helix domain-containing protein [Solirubrobacterales bacterium]
DVLYGYRLQLFDLAARTSVSHACRIFGVHRSTYYRWKRQVDRHGLGMLRPRERRRPRMPNQLSAVVEQLIVAFSLGHPGLGPDRIAAELRRDRWGGIIVSPNGVWRVLCRHGVNTRAKRLGLVAGYAAPYQPPRPSPTPAHIEVSHPGELVGMDCFFVGRLRDSKHPVWQVTAIDCYSSYAWADLITCPTGQPTHTHTSRLARRVAADLARCGWKLERVITDNGTEFKGPFDRVLDAHHIRHTRIHPGRPQTNGHVENLHKTILDECWRPSFARYLHIRLTGLRADLAEYLHLYNTDRAHTGRLTQGRIPTDILDPAHKMRPRA